MATYTKTITITRPSGTVTGTLVITTGTPNTGTFTPMTPIAGTLINCTGAPVWTETANGTITFVVKVDGTANNGSFEPGTYTFSGTQDANGNPHGHVTWPATGDAGGIVEDDLWQASG